MFITITENHGITAYFKIQLFLENITGFMRKVRLWNVESNGQFKCMFFFQESPVKWKSLGFCDTKQSRK